MITVGLADDQQLVRAGFAMVLDSQDDIAVAWEAADGAEACELAVAQPVDMILMDVQMPVMNGYEATKAIRRSSHKLAKTIPIIAMTANAFSEDIQHSLTADMNAHVSKPVEMKVLEKTIRSIKSGGGGVPNRRSLYSDEWKVTGHRRIKKDS